MAIWKSVVGYEGLYEVSDEGLVRRQKPNGSTELKSRSVCKDGYFIVVLTDKEGGKGTRFVHGLVAAAFIGKKPDGHSVNHRDGNKINNRLDNLEYVTHTENVHHAHRVLRPAGISGCRGNSKLTWDQVVWARAEYDAGRETVETLIKKLGVHKATVVDLVTWRTWKRHPNEPWTGPVQKERFAERPEWARTPE